MNCPICCSEILGNDHSFCYKCGASLVNGGHTGQLNPDILLEGRYLIIKTLGRGGMGAVYLALDQRLNNAPVAIKEMSTNAVGSGNLQAAIGAFQKEASMLVALRHPALPRITDFFPHGGDRWYLVMDYIEGKTLKQIVKERGPIPEVEVLEWARQLGDILSYLHNQNPPIIFRDLKPSNIMLTPQGQIKLIDFGIARHFKPGISSDTTAYGSSGFAPPEQYGQKQTDIRSDIYSFGATLHYLLTGIDPIKRPFDFEPISKFMKISLQTENIIMNALELKAENRPNSVQEMIGLFPVVESKQVVAQKDGIDITENIMKANISTTPVKVKKQVPPVSSDLRDQSVALGTSINVKEVLETNAQNASPILIPGHGDKSDDSTTRILQNPGDKSQVENQSIPLRTKAKINSPTPTKEKGMNAFTVAAGLVIILMLIGGYSFQHHNSMENKNTTESNSIIAANILDQSQAQQSTVFGSESPGTDLTGNSPPVVTDSQAPGADNVKPPANQVAVNPAAQPKIHYNLKPVQIDDRWGYIDQNSGQMIVQPVFIYADTFSEGFAKVVLENQSYAYINDTGEIAIGPLWGLTAGRFSEGLVMIAPQPGVGNYINYQGQVVLRFPTKEGYHVGLEGCPEFHNGLLQVLNNDHKFGFVDKTGNVRINFMFDYAYEFSNGVAKVTLNGKEGYVDTNGNVTWN